MHCIIIIFLISVIQKHIMYFKFIRVDYYFSLFVAASIGGEYLVKISTKLIKKIATIKV